MLTALPFAAKSQDESKYLKGAVTYDDDKIVFYRNIETPGLSADQIFNAVKGWSVIEFSGEGQQVLIVNPEKKSVTVRGSRKINVRVGLFPSKVNANFFAEFACADGVCKIKYLKLHYTNNPSSKNPTDVLTAEEYISDRYALNKAGTKLLGGTGSYRKETIDMIDEITEKAKNAIYDYNTTEIVERRLNTTIPVSDDQNYREPVKVPKLVEGKEKSNIEPPLTAEKLQHSEQSEPADKAEPDPVTVRQQSVPDGFMAIPATKIPGNIIKAVSDNGIRLVAVNGATLESEITGEGGLGVKNGVPALFFIAEGLQPKLSIADRVTFQFVNEVYKNAVITIEPWMIIECSVEQVGGELVTGRIETVWVK